MSEKPVFEDDDIYDFDYLKEDSGELCRPKLKPRETQEVNDNRVKLPPVLIGRNVAAINEAKQMKAPKRVKTRSALNSTNAEKDWHKERQKLKGSRQPLKEEVSRTFDLNEPWRKTKLPKINNVSVEPTLEAKRIEYPDWIPNYGQQLPKQLEKTEENLTEAQKVLKMAHKAIATAKCGYTGKQDCVTDEVNKPFTNTDTRVHSPDSEITYRGKMMLGEEPNPPTDKRKIDDTRYSTTKRSLGHNNQSIQQPPVNSSRTYSPVKEFTYQEKRPRVRFAGNAEMNQDVSVHNESKPFYKPRPKTPYEIDYDEEIRQATELSKGLEELHRELQNKDPEIAENVESIDDALHIQTDEALNKALNTASKLRLAHELTWNGENARKGVGFVSKSKKQSESKSSTGVNMQLPEKIRKQMKKYFN